MQAIWRVSTRLIGGDDLPVETRIKRMAFGLTMLIVLLLGGAMLILTLLDIPDGQIQSNQSNATVIGKVLSSDINNRIHTVRHLSQSSLVWTSLTDSTGREAYLRPFLQEQDVGDSDSIPMQLFDYRGRPILGSLPSTIQAQELSDLVSQVLKENQPKLKIVPNDGSPQLIALYPVIFPYTQDPIGVLAGKVDLLKLFKLRSEGISSDSALEMMHDGHVIAATAIKPQSVYFPVYLNLEIGSSDKSGLLGIRLSTTKNPWLLPIMERLLLSALFAALLGAFAWFSAGVIAQRISHRLNKLADACLSLAEGRATSIPTDTAKDEIGILSRTLRQAVDSYETINSNLENIVIRKTKKLSESEQRFRSFFENNSSVMLLTEPESGEIIDANMAAANYYQVARERLIGMHMDHLGESNSKGNIDEKQQAILERQHFKILKHRISTGEMRDVEIYSTLIASDERLLLFSIIHDITERKQLEVRVRQLAFYDALTNLPNRRLLDDRLEQAMSANKRNGSFSALLFLDLDNFKPLNDSYGHALGDLLLMQVAERLKDCVREMDTVARIGGDEFVVLLSELDKDKNSSSSKAHLVAEKIRNSLSSPYILNVINSTGPDTVVEHHCTASIGGIVFSSREADRDDIFKSADAAMYQAKEAGRNTVRFV